MSLLSTVASCTVGRLGGLDSLGSGRPAFCKRAIRSERLDSLSSSASPTGSERTHVEASNAESWATVGSVAVIGSAHVLRQPRLTEAVVVGHWTIVTKANSTRLTSVANEIMFGRPASAFGEDDGVVAVAPSAPCGLREK